MARSAVIPRLLIVGTVLAIAGLGVVLLPHGDQPVVRLAQTARDTGSAGVAIFFLVYVVSTVALLPGSVLTSEGPHRGVGRTVARHAGIQQLDPWCLQERD
jgi:uncharacterized membrane protein YdjX (TVP38/TMEM64 family)